MSDKDYVPFGDGDDGPFGKDVSGRPYLGPAKRAEDWVIEFRSGSFLTTLDAELGGPRSKAKGFPSKEAAEQFADQHRWIWYNGGMVTQR